MLFLLLHTVILLVLGDANNPSKHELKERKEYVINSISEMKSKCEAVSDGTHKSVKGLEQEMRNLAYTNCLFALRWVQAYHQSWLQGGRTLEPQETPVSPLLTEEDFAAYLWKEKYGAIWKACRPQKQYQHALDRMGSAFQISHTDGDASCSLDRHGGIVSCSCAPEFVHLMKNVFPEDQSAILNGTCRSEKGRENRTDNCIPGARWLSKMYAKSSQCNQISCVNNVKWYAVLKTLSQMEESFINTAHMNYDDFVRISLHFEYMFSKKDSCPSGDEYASRRPTSHMPCMSKDVIKEKMKQRQKPKIHR